jgi:hypothetical protein
MFIVPAQGQWTSVQRLNPKNKGVSPYLPLQAGYRSKKQDLTQIWLHATVLATSPPHPWCYVIFFTFRFFKFYLPFPLLLYQNTDLLASFLALLPDI